MKLMIEKGHTNNIKYLEDGKFFLEKTYTGFNHLLDYSQLNIFDFVPKLVSDSKDLIITEEIQGEHLTKPTDSDLQVLAKQLRVLHKSDVKLPKNNLRKRIQNYIEIINKKGLKIVSINNFYKDVHKIMANMGQVNPCHNDIWEENLLKTSSGAIYIVDWEYATMGDKHFDLAYYIESARLNPSQEDVLLAAYSSLDEQLPYSPDLLKRYKRLVLYITICWAYAQDQMPFDISWVEKKLSSLKP